MYFEHPWFLLILAAVAAAAALALWRPAKRVVTVGSLSLWDRAVRSAGRQTSRGARRISPSWLLLLLGAVAAVTAASAPVLSLQRNARTVAIAPVPAIELDDPAGLRQAAKLLLGRLSPQDRVELLLPEVLGGRIGPLSPAQAARRIDELNILPGGADALLARLPDAGDTQTWYFVPAGLDVPGGPGIHVVRLPVPQPEVAIESAGLTLTRDGRAQLYLALRTDQPGATATVDVTGYDSNGEAQALASAQVVAADRKAQLVRSFEAPAALAIQARPTGRTGPAAATVFFARRPRKVQAVAITGNGHPLLRRFVRIHPDLELTADAADADLLLVNRADPPPTDIPAIVFGPPSPPPGWQSSGAGQFHLGLADVAADDPVMKDVDLAGVVVRDAELWRSVLVGPGNMKVLAAMEDRGAVMLRTTPETQPQSPGPRRIYASFSIAGSNTNFAVTGAFVVFLANAVDWLLADTDAGGDYVNTSPVEAGPVPGWDALLAPRNDQQGPLPWPGIYRDPSGELRAISLPPAPEPSPRDISPDWRGRITEAQLPEPMPVGHQWELWRMLTLAAGLFWLAGWMTALR